MLNQISLDQLSVFHQVATNLSIKTAAKELGVTPSAVSQSIQKIELALGQQLFLREHKRIILSSAGQTLSSMSEFHFKNTIQSLNDFIQLNNSREPIGTIAIGAPAEFGSRFLIQWFSEFQKKYPKAKIKLRLGSPKSLIGFLTKGEVDLIIADDGPYYAEIQSSYSIRPIFNEELVVCYSGTFGKKATSFAAVAQLPHLDYSTDGSAIGIWYRHHFKKVPKKIDLVMVSENVRALIHGVKNSLGIAMIPRYMISEELKKNTISLILPTAKPLLNNLLLIQHLDKVPSQTEKLFLEMLQKKHSGISANVGKKPDISRADDGIVLR